MPTTRSRFLTVVFIISKSKILCGEESSEVPTLVGLGLCGEFIDMSYGYPG